MVRRIFGATQILREITKGRNHLQLWEMAWPSPLGNGIVGGDRILVDVEGNAVVDAEIVVAKTMVYTGASGRLS
jgi:hypothetical protein